MVFPLKLENSLICTRERETRGLVLQSISKVNNLCLVSKYYHVWVQADDFETEKNQHKGPDQTTGSTGVLLLNK